MHKRGVVIKNRRNSDSCWAIKKNWHESRMGDEVGQGNAEAAGGDKSGKQGGENHKNTSNTCIKIS